EASEGDGYVVIIGHRLAVSDAGAEGPGLATDPATGPAGEPLVYVAHQLNSPGEKNDFMTSVSAGLSTVALAGGTLEAAHSLDLNDPAFSTPSTTRAPSPPHPTAPLSTSPWPGPTR
ncbi:MAG TPA: hypothetical protein VFD39_00525, partial [Trueperaceae bacterium]|nr:hypothetical protein [Trueperaceae bacterium]